MFSQGNPSGYKGWVGGENLWQQDDLLAGCVLHETRTGHKRALNLSIQRSVWMQEKLGAGCGDLVAVGHGGIWETSCYLFVCRAAHHSGAQFPYHGLNSCPQQ